MQQRDQLLSILHGGGAYGYWWTSEARQSFWWEVGKPTALPGGRRNVYFGVHPATGIPPTNALGETKPPAEVRSQIAYIAAVNCLFAEWDAKDFNGDKAAALGAIDALDPPPSVVVDSGGGYHCYWLLATPWMLDTDTDRDKARKLQAAWVRHVGSDPQSKDLARVLRVPGTYNQKYDPPRPVAFVRAAFETTYAIDELAALCAHLIESDRPAAASGSDDEHSAWLTKALAGEIAKVAGAGEGLKHNRLRDSAIALGGLVHLGLSEQVIEDSLYAAIAERASDKQGARKTIRDGIGYGKARPRTIPEHMRSVYSANNANSASTIKSEWGHPIPFHSLDLPAFPTEVFPDWLRAFVEAEAEATQTPSDLAGMLALAVLSTCCARHIVVQPKRGWFEPVNTFVMVSLPPASGKSPVFAAMVAPLVEEERKDASESKEEIAKHTAHKEILEQKLTTAKREAAQATGQQHILDALQKVDQLAEEVATTDIPTTPRLIVDDISSEQLASMLCEHGGRIAALSPEGDIFSIMAGRYSANSTPNFSVYLKAHAGDHLRVDRKGRPAEYVERPALTMGLTVQPDILRGMAGKEVFRGLGLLGRFLYALPKSLVGSRHIDSAPVPDNVSVEYHHTVIELLRGCRMLAAMYSANNANSATGTDSGNSGNSGVRSHFKDLYLLSFSKDATVLFREFRFWLEPKLAEGAEFASFTDWAGKLNGTVARLAGLLHMAETCDHPHAEIAADTLERAITVVQYLIPHARAAFAEIGADPAVSAARLILAWIARKQQLLFTKRDAFEGVKGRFKRAADLDPVLELLSDHNYIRPRDMDDRPGPGRKPSQVYDVNPVLLTSQYSHNSQNIDPDLAFTPFVASHNSHNSQNGHVPTLASEGIAAELPDYSYDSVEVGGKEVWRLWDDHTDQIVGEYPTKAAALEAANEKRNPND
jgi:replicative DNA helicase